MAQQQTDVLIAGDGPTGLSAALFLAKNGVTVDVYGQDKTALHSALLLNYPGIERITGTDFVRIARAQAANFGARLHDATVTEVEAHADGIQAHTSDGGTWRAQHFVLANGPDLTLARALGVATEGKRVIIDTNGRTSVERVYAGGWVARGGKIQAVISAGDGAAIALDILSKKKGKDFHDFDTP